MNGQDGAAHERRGAIAYMARNGVAANLLMFFIVAAGLLSLTGLVQEAFPELSFGTIEVTVRYPGAGPEEVEQSIVVKIEEQVGSLDGVREVTSAAAEGVASVMVELKTGTDMSRALDDVESAVNRIQTFPAQAERPEIGEMTNRQSVMRLVLYGDVSERALKELAYRTEDAIGALPAVSQVETSGVRSYEISIEAPSRRLQALGLTLEDVSEAVRRGTLDLSAGRIETGDAQVRVRTTGQRYDQQDFEELVVLSRTDGTLVRLGDIAEVHDGFQSRDLIVVDDAIVVAESVHRERMRGTQGVPAAIRGTQRVSRPLIFAVLTSVAAFSPLLFIPGGLGELMRAVPVILIAMLLTSLVESLFVLPNHLSHLPGPGRRPSNVLDRACARSQAQVDRGLQWFVEGPLDRGLRVATRHPAIVIAAGLGAMPAGTRAVHLR